MAGSRDLAAKEAEQQPRGLSPLLARVLPDRGEVDELGDGVVVDTDDGDVPAARVTLADIARSSASASAPPPAL
ncbi:MAG: hypothetical protein ABJA74_00955 [Lapillicoccus sp.]